MTERGWHLVGFDATTECMVQRFQLAGWPKSADPNGCTAICAEEAAELCPDAIRPDTDWFLEYCA